MTSAHLVARRTRRHAQPRVAATARPRGAYGTACAYSQHHCTGCGEAHGFGRCGHAARLTESQVRDRGFAWG